MEIPDNYNPMFMSKISKDFIIFCYLEMIYIGYYIFDIVLSLSQVSRIYLKGVPLNQLSFTDTIVSVNNIIQVIKIELQSRLLDGGSY